MPIRIYVCGTLDCYRRFTGNDRSGGQTNPRGKIFISPKPENTAVRVPFVVAHELTHLHLVQRCSAYRAAQMPSWFNEGFAALVSNGGGAEGVSDAEAARAIVASWTFTPTTEHGFSGSHFGLPAHMFYRQAALFILPPLKRCRLRLYDAAVRAALVVLWEASDRICGTRLKPLLPVLLTSLERHGHLQLDGEVRAKLVAASASTIDRLLAEPRGVAGRKRHARAVPAIRASIPVRTFADWKEPLPGFMEADLVSHGGETVAGSFVHTLTLTDIATGWTECVALVVREATLVVEALCQLRAALPFPLRGFDTDNGSEFIDEAVLAYCTAAGIEFTRSRPYRKNDQAWVEQKNGSVVRRLVGYRRLDGLNAAQALSRLYAASRLFVNFFQPSFKLAEKKRVGARVTKRYHAPETPCARLLKSSAVSEGVKERLQNLATTLDPLRLLDEIRAVQHQLAQLAAGKQSNTTPPRDPDLDRFMKSLATAWHDGEARPTHQSPPRPQRDWRTRKDPFETAWPRVLAWLENEPDRTGRELFERLQSEEPFPDGQLRTLQRKLKAWRRAAAHRLVFATKVFLDDGASAAVRV